MKFCCSWNVVTFQKMYLRLTSAIFPRFRSLSHFTKSQFGGTSSLLMKVSFFKIIFLRIKSKMLLEFGLNWLWYVSFFLALCLTPFFFISDSSLRLRDLLTTVSCARQNMMTSAKGSRLTLQMLQSLYLKLLCAMSNSIE